MAPYTGNMNTTSWCSYDLAQSDPEVMQVSIIPENKFRELHYSSDSDSYRNKNDIEKIKMLESELELKKEKKKQELENVIAYFYLR